MDYSQFGSMIPELIVLGIFMLVFLFDTFSNENGKKILTPFTTVLFGLGTIAIWSFRLAERWCSEACISTTQLQTL